MSRCGCASQCPPCPQNVYVDSLFGTPIVMSITSSTPVEFPIAIRPVSIPAMLPGFGFTSVAEFNAGTGDDQNNLNVSWVIKLDGTIIANRQKISWGSEEWEGEPIVAGVQSLSAGNHTIVFSIFVALDVFPGPAATFILFGGAMRTDLIRVPTLVVTP